VFISSEAARAMGLSAEVGPRIIGMSAIMRTLAATTRGFIRVTRESGTAWWQHNAPIMRRYLEPGDPDFDEVFGPTAPAATQLDPIEAAPRAWHDTVSFPPDLPFRRSMLGDHNQVHVRINDDAGRFIGVLYLYRGTVPESLMQRLGRGDPRLFERMERVSEPGRRPAGVLFADLEASGAVSRRLSSRGYFDLVSDLTDLIDTSVIARDGIVGKHAGDGGSALFLATDFDGRSRPPRGRRSRRPGRSGTPERSQSRRSERPDGQSCFQRRRTRPQPPRRTIAAPRLGSPAPLPNRCRGHGSCGLPPSPPRSHAKCQAAYP
jgi:hypothetical protein